MYDMALTNPDLFDFIRIILFLVAEGGIGSYRIKWSGGSESILINYECCCPTKAMIEIRHVDKNVEPLRFTHCWSARVIFHTLWAPLGMHCAWRLMCLSLILHGTRTLSPSSFVYSMTVSCQFPLLSMYTTFWWSSTQCLCMFQHLIYIPLSCIRRHNVFCRL